MDNLVELPEKIKAFDKKLPISRDVWQFTSCYALEETERKIIESDPALAERIGGATFSERANYFINNHHADHPWWRSQDVIDSWLAKIPKLLPSQMLPPNELGQNARFARLCHMMGNKLQSQGLYDPQYPVDAYNPQSLNANPYAKEVFERAVAAGLKMKNGDPGNPWNRENLAYTALYNIKAGLEGGNFLPWAPTNRLHRHPPQEAWEPSDTSSASEFGVAVKEWGEEEIGQFLARMNRDHALVSLGSSVRYLHVTPKGEQGSSKFDFLKAEDMRRLYANVHIPFGGGRKKNGFELWDQWPGRRQYRGVGLFPTGHAAPPVPDGYLNLWQGFAVEPKKGDWNLFHDHLRDVVCGGNEAHFNWLMDWLAHLFQRPYEKPGVAVVLKSRAKGTGKSMVLGFLRKVLGKHAMSVSHAKHITGNFNGHLADTILLGAEEAFWAGSKPAEGVIKDLITNDYLAIERKGVDAVSQRNYMRLMITSNEAWSVPAGIDERRFFVMEVHNPRAKDRTYFEPIFEQMEAGGLEAMLFDLLNREIKSDLRNPPETSALLKEREQSLDGPAHFLLDTARDGFIEINHRKYDDVSPDRQALFNEDKPTEFRTDAVRDAATKYRGRYEDSGFAKKLGELLSRVGVVKSRTRDNGRRLYVYRFPPLPVFRKAVENELRVPVAGNEEASEFDYFDPWFRKGKRR